MGHQIYPNENYIILSEGESIQEVSVSGCGASSAPYLYQDLVYQAILANITTNYTLCAKDINGNIYHSLPPACVWILEDGTFFNNTTGALTVNPDCETLVPYSGPPDFDRLDSETTENILAEWTTWDEYKADRFLKNFPDHGDLLVVQFETEALGTIYFQNLGLSYMKVVEIAVIDQYSNIHTFEPQPQQPFNPAKGMGISVPLALFGLGLLSILSSGSAAAAAAAATIHHQQKEVMNGQENSI